MTEELKNAPKKLSLQRRTKTTVSGTSASGKSKEVQVEVKNVQFQQKRHKELKKPQN